MLTRRLMIALLAAVVVSGVFTFLLGRYVVRSHASSSGHLSYVATARKMEAGEILTPADLQMVNWPSTVPLAGASQHIEEVTGRAVLYPLAGGEPVLDQQLSASGQTGGLSPRIPDGMRAISLKSDQVVGVAGYLLPGTHVDVMATLHEPGSSDPVTTTVVQDAEIITAGQKMQPDPEGKATSVDVVTLLVTPEDAETLVLASTQGTVHFVLRNGSDHAHVDDKPIQLSSLGGAPRAPQPRAAAAPERPTPEPKHYSVEIQQGDKQSVEGF